MVDQELVSALVSLAGMIEIYIIYQIVASLIVAVVGGITAVLTR